MIKKIFQIFIPKKKPNKYICPGWLLNGAFNTEEYENNSIYEVNMKNGDIKKLNYNSCK